jgi:geranylgeranyl pyrophosphate synthase
MYGKKQWRGREVEGRYSDIMTFFIRELGDGINVDDLREYPHYYFTIEYVEKMIRDKTSDHLDAIREILDTTNSAVTIEANTHTLKLIATDLFNRCHIIYRIQDDAVQMLKDTDTLSIDAGWYRVHQITKCNMMEINPDNYKFDEEL